MAKENDLKKDQITEATPQDAHAVQDISAAALAGNHEAHWPISVVGAFIGMLAGTLPASIWALVFSGVFTPLYVFVPLFIYYGIRIFRGYDGRRGFVLTLIFSLLGLYLTALSVLATVDVLRFKMFILNLPLVTIGMIGKSGIPSSPFLSSANVFPVVFTAIGVALAYELLMKRRRDAIAETDAAANSKTQPEA